MNDLVSIIVPIFNSEKYLKRCIVSILNQTYQNIEVILVDDGSTDNSPHICDEAVERDSRIKVFHNSNQGVSAARNFGIIMSTGKYIMFVDSDDELFNNAVYVLYSDIIKFNADITSGLKMKCHENKNNDIFISNGKCIAYKGIDPLKLALSSDPNTNSSCAKLFKKIFIQGLEFTEGKQVNEDSFFMFLCFARKPVFVQHNIYIYKYYFHGSSASNSEFSSKYLDIIYFCNEKKKIIENNFPYLINEMKNLEVRSHLIFLQVLCRSKDNQYKLFEDASLEVIKKYADGYKPKNRNERILLFLICCNLFYIYKFIFQIKYIRK